MTSEFASAADAAVPLYLLEPGAVGAWLNAQDSTDANWVRAQGFKGLLGECVVLPGPDGNIKAALIGWGIADQRRRGRFHLAAIQSKLPAGTYTIASGLDPADQEAEALGWLLGSYRFSRYKAQNEPGARLVCPEGLDATRLQVIAAGVRLTSDLINTPTSDLGPDALENAFLDLGTGFGAKVAVIRGGALLDQNLPMIHAVGRASDQDPRLLDLRWGPPGAPRVTLVGKGVCFDTGGLNIKPGASMGLMKKDMGGAANVMGLARMIMSLGVNVQLRVLVPAVENSISAGAFRPGDILTSRKGLTVEINNTDAEGRLVLADALTMADEEKPELLICMATLTGAARVALGPDLPPYFTDDATLAADLETAAQRVADPLWRLPFWPPYEPMIEPDIADLDNAPKGGMAGAITAALFLKRFVSDPAGFAHIDCYGWVPSEKPGRPKGGASQGARAILDVIASRYGQADGT